MTVQIPQVRPGDLITASLFNDLIEQLTALDARVTELEGAPGTPAGTVVISALDKTTVRVGEDLTITGQNFGFALGAHRVRFNGISPTAFRSGSSDSVLICQVPPIPGLPKAGMPVTLTVTNVTFSGPGATATRTITVRPPEIGQAGNLDLVFVDASPDPVTAGVDNEFEFRLESDATLPTTVTITPQITVGASPAGWATAILDENRDELASGRQPIAPGEAKTIFVRVAIPANANGTACSLLVQGTAAGLEPASPGAMALTVGQNADPDATFQLSAATTRLSAASGATVTVPVEGDFTVIGEYAVTLAPVAGTTGWQTVLINPPAASPRIPITQADLDAGGSKTIQFRVRPGAGATDPGQARLTVQRSGASRQRSITFDLEVT
jgi:IPT/TIG domain